MKRSVQLFVLSLMAVLLVSATALAADVKQADTGSEAPVILYEHGIGVGKTIEPAIPSSVTNVDLDDSVSNVFIGRDDIVVVLYEHKDFGGKKVVLDKAGMHTMPDFGFNDKTSSYEVYLKPGAKVSFFEHFDGSGLSFEADNPSSGDFPLDKNDLISSVLIGDDKTVVVLREHITGIDGRSLTLDSPGLHDLMKYDFNDIASSFEIKAK